MDRWYILVDGASSGPFSATQMLAKIAQGEVTEETQMRSSPREQWDTPEHLTLFTRSLAERAQQEEKEKERQKEKRFEKELHEDYEDTFEQRTTNGSEPVSLDVCHENYPLLMSCSKILFVIAAFLFFVGLILLFCAIVPDYAGFAIIGLWSGLQCMVAAILFATLSELIKVFIRQEINSRKS